MKKAIVIGAGVAGLTAAIRLAGQGWDVNVYEKNPTVGGKMNEHHAQGFRWDIGPSVITMRGVFHDLFASVGRNLEDYITLLPVEPLTRYFYPDGTVLDASRDLPKMTDQIAQLNERDVEGYLRYLSYAARIHRITGPVFIYNDPPKLWDILSVPLHEMPAVDPLRTMSGAINSFVESPKLRQLFGRFATYTGASPYSAPATLNVIAHVELTEGVWYPRGGIYAIADGLQKLALELGVEINAGCGVQQINVEQGTATGVVLADGQTVQADAIVANLDVSMVYEKLLPSNIATQQRVEELTSVEPSCSGFIMLLGVEGTNEQLAHHNIYFSSDYPAEFRDIFDRGVPPADPTIYISISGKTDPDHAPDGCENWFVLVNAPPLGDAYDWNANTQQYRNLVLDKLAGYGLDVRQRIRYEQIYTPADLERMTNARRGALYGASSNSKWTAFRRPNNRAHDVKGLYFAGGTTHPGGGVPMVMLSGKVAARMVAEDHKYKGYIMTDDKEKQTLPDDETKTLNRVTFGEVVAQGVSADDFMAQYGAGAYEWVQSVVIKSAPVDAKHNRIVERVSVLLAEQSAGAGFTAPVFMYLAAVPAYRRPDVVYLHPDRHVDVHSSGIIDGPATICVEVVSSGSVKLDYGEKLEEYEKAGIQEYWVIDPIRSVCHFYRLTDAGHFQDVKLQDGTYSTPLVPGLQVNVQDLWQV